jgi:hypothetical protein
VYIYVSKEVRDFWLFFEAKRSPITKKFGKHRHRVFWLENLATQIHAGHDNIMENNKY